MLQYTLLKLWEKRNHNRVTEDIYKDVGGGREALARSADEVYQNLIPQSQKTARRILLSMVQLNEVLEVTNKRIRRSELDHDGEDPDRVERVLQTLIKARLVRETKSDTPQDTQIELAHEALIRNWPRFVDWLTEAHSELRFRKRFSADAERWDAAKRNHNLLWRASELDKVEQFNWPNLNDIERRFSDEAIATREKQNKNGRSRS